MKKGEGGCPIAASVARAAAHPGDGVCTIVASATRAAARPMAIVGLDCWLWPRPPTVPIQNSSAKSPVDIAQNNMFQPHEINWKARPLNRIFILTCL